MRVDEPTNPVATCVHQHQTAVNYRPSLSGATRRSSWVSTTPVLRSPDTKQIGELGQLEANLIQANFSNEERISVEQFDNHAIMSNTIQKIKFVVEQLGDSMVTNLVNSVFTKAHGIIEMATVLDTYVDIFHLKDLVEFTVLPISERTRI